MNSYEHSVRSQKLAHRLLTVQGIQICSPYSQNCVSKDVSGKQDELAIRIEASSYIKNVDHLADRLSGLDELVEQKQQILEVLSRCQQQNSRLKADMELIIRKITTKDDLIIKYKQQLKAMNKADKQMGFLKERNMGLQSQNAVLQQRLKQTQQQSRRIGYELTIQIKALEVQKQHIQKCVQEKDVTVSRLQRALGDERSSKVSRCLRCYEYSRQLRDLYQASVGTIVESPSEDIQFRVIYQKIEDLKQKLESKHLREHTELEQNLNKRLRALKQKVLTLQSKFTQLVIIVKSVPSLVLRDLDQTRTVYAKGLVGMLHSLTNHMSRVNILSRRQCDQSKQQRKQIESLKLRNFDLTARMNDMGRQIHLLKRLEEAFRPLRQKFIPSKLVNPEQ